MVPRIKLLVFVIVITLTSLACQAVTGAFQAPEINPSPTQPIGTVPPTKTAAPTLHPAPTSTPTQPPTELLPPSIEAGEINSDEPVFITGEIPYTSPFFLDTLSDAFVMLEDQGGFIERDLTFEFPLLGQVIGPVKLVDEDTVNFQLALPAIPQGTQVDVDNDGELDTGVQIFAVAYWSNTWGGPFLETRDGTGWSTGYASTTTDADRDDEINGGTLVVWSADDGQGFPTGFGKDGILFSDDDPTAPIESGYTLIDLDETPFRFYKETQPHLTLYEGDAAVNDFSDLSYEDAFSALFDKVSREYPFTVEKEIDWETLYEEYSPRIAKANSDEDFFWALKAFSLEISDAHIGIGFNDMIGQLFFENYGGSFGMILVETSDSTVLVTAVLPDSPAAEAGIEVGAEIITWNGDPVSKAISEIEPFFGPYSTDHHKRFEQLVFLTRVEPGETAAVNYRNTGESGTHSVEMEAVVEYDSMFNWIPSFAGDELALPIEADILDNSGLGYIKINTFSDDYNLMAQLWDRYIQELIEWEVPGIIIDIRVNGGGSSGLASDFNGYFFDDEIEVMKRLYYNKVSGQFEMRGIISRIIPGPMTYDGPIAVLVGPYCVSACEGFAYTLSLREDVTVLGHFSSAGAYGEVGRGHYELPADLSMQFPTGRSETPEGTLLIEGTGVVPDILVPLTDEAALGQIDVLRESAIEVLLQE